MNKTLILYVDDEPDALRFMKSGLEDRGYTVVTAESGESALEILKTHVPDVIVTDLRMQPMNGFELFQKVKKDSRNSSVPFFFLTAVNDAIAQKYGQILGVDAYISKPVELDDFDAMIRRKLKL